MALKIFDSKPKTFKFMRQYNKALSQVKATKLMNIRTSNNLSYNEKEK